MTPNGFHEGELAVQRAAGVQHDAARLAGMLGPPNLSGGLSRFLAERDFAAVAARDGQGRLWASPLLDEPGFLSTGDHTLSVHVRPPAEDPLAHLPAGQALALIAIDFASRRRVRVNGKLVSTADGLKIDVDQAFGNCPRYIQQREIRHPRTDPKRASTRHEWHQRPAHVTSAIEQADTFFLATTHPSRGADISHRGGPRGFVRIDGDALWWPDYPGNNMFNSLGNLAVDPHAALLFIDFTTGATLHLSGTAQLEQIAPLSTGDDGATGRRVRFTPSRLVTGARIALASDHARPSPHNPPIT